MSPAALTDCRQWVTTAADGTIQHALATGLSKLFGFSIIISHLLNEASTGVRLCISKNALGLQRKRRNCND